MPQGKILGLQRCPGPKSLPNQGKEQENGCDHGLTNLSRRWLKFNQVSETRVFGRDRTSRRFPDPNVAKRAALHRSTASAKKY
jgi:hypothetical protein